MIHLSRSQFYLIQGNYIIKKAIGIQASITCSKRLALRKRAIKKDFNLSVIKSFQILIKSQSKFDLALYHYEKFHSIRESVFKEESENRLKNLESLYHTETVRKEGEIDHLEKQLRQSQKLEAIGTMAGGIAHEFNNILAAILGFTELGLHTLSPQHHVYGYLQEVEKAGKRAKDLVQQILAFGRRGNVEFRPISFAVLVAEALRTDPRIAAEHDSHRAADRNRHRRRSR